MINMPNYNQLEKEFAKREKLRIEAQFLYNDGNYVTDEILNKYISKIRRM